MVNKFNEVDVKDRRRFFRIDDEVNLFYKIVDEQSVITATQVTADLLSNCSLVTALDVLNQESMLIMHRIEKNTPEIAEYLKVLESKINVLSRAVLMQDNDFAENAMRKANMSASGLAFDNESKIKEGTFLEIKLLLTSCLAVITVYGKVIYCNENESQTSGMAYQIGVDYFDLNEEDREVLIKHIIKRQMQQIREQKQNKN